MKEHFGRILNSKMLLNDLGILVEKHWKMISDLQPNIDLDEFIIMPNHIYGIIIIDWFDKTVVETAKFTVSTF
jgi:putative transposase